MALASASGDELALCMAYLWGETSTLSEEVDVVCYTRSGRLVDIPFVVSFTNRSAGGRFSYLLAGPLRRARLDRPSVLLRYDSTGGKAWVKRTSIGHYLVYVPASAGLPSGAQFYQVAANDFTYCKLSAIPASSGIQQVTCRDTYGDFADSPFSITFSADTSIIGRTDHSYGYVSSADTSSVHSIGLGDYVALVRGSGPLSRPATGLRSGGAAVAYAVGQSDAYCHIVSWAISNHGAAMTAWVKCWSISTGRPVNSRFSVGATW